MCFIFGVYLDCAVFQHLIATVVLEVEPLVLLCVEVADDVDLLLPGA